MSRETTLEAIATKTRQMRAAQKEFFKGRDRAVLAKSKSLERDVDKLLHELENTPATDLFNRPGESG